VAIEALAPELTIDQLANEADVPARTIREYQTLGLLRPPRRRGRVGAYDGAHLARLRLISRLQERGYSLAGIRDLIGAWTEGDDLAGVLGDDELPMPDEAGLVVRRDDLPAWLAPIDERDLAAFEALGLSRTMPDGNWCLPAPSLLRLVADATRSGLDSREVTAIVTSVAEGVRAIAAEVAPAIHRAFRADVDPAITDHLARRGRALLAQGAARLLVQELADALASAPDPADAERGARLVEAARTDAAHSEPGGQQP
jgi:DNA-binding transcriptional MerR regulator